MRCIILNAPFLVFNAQSFVSNTEFLVFNAKFIIFSITNSSISATKLEYDLSIARHVYQSYLFSLTQPPLRKYPSARCIPTVHHLLMQIPSFLVQIPSVFNANSISVFCTHLHARRTRSSRRAAGVTTCIKPSFQSSAGCDQRGGVL